MRRRYAQPALPNLYFRDGVLSVPGYTFDKARPWEDTGSMTFLAEGMSLKDGSNVLAKIASAHTNASVCIEREAHILERMATTSESASVTLRMIDFFNVPKTSGDCVVLLLIHPGHNVLGRYFPPSKVNDLLLSDVSRTRPAIIQGDVYMIGVEEPEFLEDMEPMEIMDLASFLEFAIQATKALELIHRAGFIHREVRANAFHLNSHSGLVRLVHFGNRAVSLEQFGVPSTFVLRSDALEEMQKLKVKEALCYLAPEQSGGMESTTEDHRTDLYALGVMFWTLLVGRGTLPFEGGPLELLHAIVQKRPMPVHEVRRDVPQVLAMIIDKLLAKSPDSRYQSAYGLRHDLNQCQKRLLDAVTLATEQASTELIPFFDIGTQDKYMDFTIPSPLFGREKELETIRNVIRHASTSYSRHVGSISGTFVVSSSASHGTGTAEEVHSDSGSSKSESILSPSGSGTIGHMNAPSPIYLTNGTYSNGSQHSWQGMTGSGIHSGSPGVDTISSSDGLRRVALGPSSRRARTHAVVVSGPAGAGKSSLILANQAKWRSHGLWGQAKFTESEAAPFSTLLSCMSSVLRQLIVFHTDLHRFVTSLRVRLGPQLHNVPLLYQGVPELKDILALFDISLDTPQEALETHELRARFEALVESVFAVLSETRLFALFLDDIHDAPESSLDLIRALLNSRSRMLIFATARSDKQEILDKLRAIFASRAATWITLEPLSFMAVSSLVSRTLRRSKEDTQSLSRLIHAASLGNAFSVRNILSTLQRQALITYNSQTNSWDYNMRAIETTLAHKQTEKDPNDISFLVAQLRDLEEEAKKYLLWASFFGLTFKVTEVALMMDWEDSSGSSSEDDVDDIWQVQKAVHRFGDHSTSTTRGSMRGLQLAIQEGWLVQRARDMCSFTHDRFRQAAQAEVATLSETTIAKMSFRIILMMLHENPDIYRIAEHAKHCLPLLREHHKRDQLLDLSIDAGDSARARGAHELALQSYTNALSLLDDDPWHTSPARTIALYLKIAELSTWKGEYEISNAYVAQCLLKSEESDIKAQIMRIRARNHFMRGSYTDALNDTIAGLHLLGVDVNPSPTRREADAMFEQVKNEILAVGFEEILNIPRARDARTDLAIALLNDAGANAYYSTGEGFADVIGLTTIRLALRAGMCPGSALGFFWALGAAAERKELYRFSADLGKLALRLANQYGSSHEKCRALVMFCPLVSGYDSAHIRTNIPRLEDSLKYGQSAGDKLYCSFASLHLTMQRLFVCDHLSELLPHAEESLSDVTLWSQNADLIVFSQALLNCVRALAGQTRATSAETIFDTEEYDEKDFINLSEPQIGNYALAMNWYNSFKVVALFCLGFSAEAAELGFYVYETRDKHPNHRHIRYGLFFHSLALIHCIRNGQLPPDTYVRYMKQVEVNQTYIRKWLSPSPVNNSTWIALVDAEMASLMNSPDAFKLYDVAVKLAVNNDWLLEEAWGLFLQGSHFVRCGVEGLGGELQRRGISRQSQWGARGVVNHLSSLVSERTSLPLKRHIFSSDVAVQTDSVMVSSSPPSVDDDIFVQQSRTVPTDEDVINKLTSADLASILRWSKEISKDINLSLALQSLTEIATENSGSQSTCVVIAREAGDYTVATSMLPPEPCQVHENPIPVRAIVDPLQRAAIQHALNTKTRIYLEDVSSEPRFATEARESNHRSIICLPIFSNRGQTFGALYLASKYAFSPNTVTVLTLLCEQASIGIANALLFRSVQAGTRENLKMIAAQKEALEAARKSREDALKATKIKSNFLASMSHELRTPFSSFYGLLDILSGTDLNMGQREIVATAKQSCELLLKIIDSILDYSKLEASALKLEFSAFPVENIIADCMELLLPMAAKKLDLSFNIESDVPPWVTADYDRIRQVLMNLIGNAVKFTLHGFVRVTCSVDRAPVSSPGEASLKFVIQDTGIGLSPSDVDLLFVPFQQADNSSTRRFGGTGLGLSISRQLVKLMGGAIGVQSELGKGSLFWFTIPVKICESDESQVALAEIDRLKMQLLKPHPLRVLVVSQSPATVSLLSTMFAGFFVSAVSSIDDARDYLRNASTVHPPLDFILLDDQSETRADELARFLHNLPSDPLRDTKLLHLYTPTTDSMTGHSAFQSNIPGVVRMTKPPRKARLLQMLAILKNPDQNQVPTIGLGIQAEEQRALEQRMLFGYILIAEDNPVAQKLLIKQLERFDLRVVATSNGEEAIAEWESHEPGYFSAALFDHHMPICDGVEACKRIRVLENKRRAAVLLPIVALSADCQESTKQLCLSAGMNAFLSKPLRRSDLVTLLCMFGTPPSLKPPG